MENSLAICFNGRRYVIINKNELHTLIVFDVLINVETTIIANTGGSWALCRTKSRTFRGISRGIWCNIRRCILSLDIGASDG